MSTTAGRNIAAEARAVEEGHRAFVQDDGSVEVVSDTHHGKRYRVTFVASSLGPIVFTCTPHHGPHLFDDDHLTATSRHPGVVPCKHAALAARRLEREGLATFTDDGRWHTTIEHRYDGPDDPFEGLT